MANLLAPKDAAKVMNISVPTITRCVKHGAPVHRWGSTGHRYRIDVSEFTAWMERQNPKDRDHHVRNTAYNQTSTEELAEKRRAIVRGL